MGDDSLDEPAVPLPVFGGHLLGEAGGGGGAAVAHLGPHGAGLDDHDLHPVRGELIEVGRRQPHLYALMFSTPVGGDPEAAAAATRVENEFLTLVADLVGESDARRYGALLMSSAHGIAGLELSGHLAKEKWTVDGDQLVRMLVDAVRSDAG